MAGLAHPARNFLHTLEVRSDNAVASRRRIQHLLAQENAATSRAVSFLKHSIPRQAKERAEIQGEESSPYRAQAPACRTQLKLSGGILSECITQVSFSIMTDESVCHWYQPCKIGLHGTVRSVQSMWPMSLGGLV